VFASVAVFCVLLVLLAERVAAGRDPVLGAPVAIREERPAVLRTIKRRVIVQTTVGGAHPHGRPSESAGPVVASATPVAEAPAPVTRSS
jgi:hypothetical protein